MGRVISCPACGHEFAPKQQAESALDAWVWVENGSMSNTTFAASRGLSSTTVTLYRRLGICIVELGLDPDAEPDLWNQLANKTKAISDYRVRTAIERRAPLDELRTLALGPQS